MNSQEKHQLQRLERAIFSLPPHIKEVLVAGIERLLYIEMNDEQKAKFIREMRELL